MSLAYLHLIHAGDEDLVARLRREWPTALLLNRAGAPLEARIADLDAGLADVVTVAVALWPTRTCQPASRRTPR